MRIVLTLMCGFTAIICQVVGILNHEDNIDEAIFWTLTAIFWICVAGVNDKFFR